MQKDVCVFVSVCVREWEKAINHLKSNKQRLSVPTWILKMWTGGWFGTKVKDHHYKTSQIAWFHNSGNGTF